MKKTIKIASLSFALAIIFSPLVSFAETKDVEHNDNLKAKYISSNIGSVANLFGLKTKTANAATMPVISGIKSPTVLSTNQVGTWTINAFDPQNTDLSYSVDWGDMPNAGLRSLTSVEPVFVQTSTFTHAYVNPGTYKITFTVKNSAGVETTSTVTVHVKQGATINTPVVSNLVATSTKPKQATLTWATDVKSDSRVWFGTTTPVDTSKTPNVLRVAKILNHKINLTKLEPDTTYYVVVGSANNVGTGTSTEISFKTPAVVNNNTPVITSVDGQSPIEAGELETVTVNAYDPKNGNLSYSVDWGDMGMMRMSLLTAEEPFIQTSTFTHVYSEPGIYTAKFTVKNDEGLEVSKNLVITVTAPVDTTAPTVSEITSSAESATSTISWVTDEPGTSKVFYSTTSPVDTTSSTTPFVFDGELTTDHSIEIPNLTASTTYYFVVESVDSSNNVGLGAESQFTTEAVTPVDTTAPVVSAIATEIGSSTSKISWTTDELATSKVFYSTSTPVDTTSSTTPFVLDSGLSRNHSLDITGLNASTTYYMVIQSSDASNNTGASSELSFTTTDM